LSESTASRVPGEPFREWFERRLLTLSERQYRPIASDLAPDFRPASVLAPFWAEGDAVNLALTLRTQTLPSHKGQISFPGGRVEDSDLSSAAAALRETQEELGIHPSRVSVVARLDDAWSIQRYLVAPHIGWLDGRPEFEPSPGEVERVIVADVERLMNPEIHHARQMQERSHRFLVDFFDYDGDIIWGLTGGILATFFRLMRGEPLGPESEGPETLSRFLGRQS
jgi:8-oxo-dGTP pyrophosphatase MutT (NUDIX family)